GTARARRRADGGARRAQRGDGAARAATPARGVRKHGRRCHTLAARRRERRPRRRAAGRRGRVRTQSLLREALAACRDVTVVYGRGETELRALDGVTVDLRAAHSPALLAR